MDKIDIVTLAVPRPMAAGMLAALFKHCKDLEECKGSWIVALDSVPLLEETYSYEQAIIDIRQAAKNNIKLELMLTDRNLGHAANFRRAIERTQGDILYMEDDKYAQRDFSISMLRKMEADQIGIEGAHRIGHTWAYYGNKKYMDALKALWPSDFVPEGQNAENYVMYKWGRHPAGLRASKVRGLVLDVGKPYRESLGLIKLETGMNFTYAKG